jgi:hypothetical protein
MTYREYLTRLAWLEEQWNAPSRSDYYTMALITVVRQLLAKNPNSITIEKARLKFSSAKSIEQTREEADRKSKAYWLPLVGLSLEQSQEEQENLNELTDESI